MLRATCGPILNPRWHEQATDASRPTNLAITDDAAPPHDLAARRPTTDEKGTLTERSAMPKARVAAADDPPKPMINVRSTNTDAFGTANR
jgi:hypothetical protein